MKSNKVTLKELTNNCILYSNYGCLTKNLYQKRVLTVVARKAYKELQKIFSIMETYNCGRYDLNHPFFIKKAIHEVDKILTLHIEDVYGRGLRYHKLDKSIDLEFIKKEEVYYKTMIKMKNKLITHIFTELQDYVLDFNSDCKSYKQTFEKNQLLYEDIIREFRGPVLYSEYDA